MEARPEDTLKDTLTNAFSKVKNCVQKIESHGTGVGIPDIYIGKGIWIETKAIDAKYDSHNAIPFRRGQYPWLLHHAKDGGCSIVAILWKENVITFSHVQELLEEGDGNFYISYYLSTDMLNIRKKEETARVLAYISTAPLFDAKVN
jgi:Holliday junction resolvase